MNKQNLIIFKLKTFYNVLKELESVINFEIFEATNEEQCKELQNKLDNYMVIISQKNQNFSRALNLEKFPIEIFKFIEKVNIQSLKHQYQDKSEINLGKYKININWELKLNKVVLKLTEKEVKIINYLNKLSKSVSIDELQLEVWGYHSKLETHTVETHIYRLRKKVLNKFKIENFIISKKDGYQINLN
jgi:DNA-binding response OmpR family regulator